METQANSFMVNDLTRLEITTTAQRLLRNNTRKEDTRGCVTCPGLKTKGDGYLQVFVHGRAKKYLFHHVLWRYYNNDVIPNGLFVGHMCGNRGCAAQEHIRLVTRAENEEMKRCCWINVIERNEIFLLCHHSPTCIPPLKLFVAKPVEKKKNILICFRKFCNFLFFFFF